MDGSERAAREAEAIDRARLGGLAHRPARVLSGGEQQRLAVARALACAPRVLFLDEPTASLDPASTHAIEQQVGEAHENGVTIVLVTHDVGQARRLGDDLLFLHAGQVVESGRVVEVLDAPRSEPARAWLEGRLYLDSPISAHGLNRAMEHVVTQYRVPRPGESIPLDGCRFGGGSS